MKAWESFLVESDRNLRRNELNRGLAYEPDPKATTVAVVEEYCDGFAWNGVGAREVTAAVRRDERGVKRALQTLVEDGKLRIEETMTRGPKASRRKTYRSTAERPVIESLSEHFDYYGSPVDRRSNEYGAGGGREILPLHPGTD